MRLFSLLTLVLLTPAFSQTKQVIPADIIIPQPPPTTPLAEWRDAPGRKAVSFQSGDTLLKGFRYEGTRTKSDPKAPEILFFNGNGMTVARVDRFYRALAAQGSTVTVYDYRGYGFSPGPAHLATFREDGLRLYDALSKQNPNLVVYGASMGTAVAAFIASERPVRGVILGMPIASVEAEFPVYAALMGFTPEMLRGVTYEPEAATIFGEADMMRRSQAPLLVLGGERDRVVPDAQAREIYAGSPAATKRFVEVPGAGHNDVILSPEALRAVREFLTSLK